MKNKYYVNKKKQENGDHEVHVEYCQYLPLPENRHYLGEYSNCHDAVHEAKKVYSTANGCIFCCPACHTS